MSENKSSDLSKNTEEKIENELEEIVDKKIKIIVERKIDYLVDKRFKDIKWSTGILSTVLTTLFTVLAGSIFINWNSEKSALDNYKKDLKNELTGKIGKPDIALFNLENSQLQDSITRVTNITIQKDQFGKIKHTLAIPVVFRNKGTGTPKKLYAKLLIRGIDIYVDKFIHVVDEPDKNYPSIWAINYSKDDIVTNIPPGQSSFGVLSTEPLDKPPAKGKYDVKLRVYYGEELENNVNADFKILYDDRTNITDLTKAVQNKG